MSYGYLSLLDEVKKLEQNGKTIFIYYPPNRMKSLYACKVLSENGYDPKTVRDGKGILRIECLLNCHRYSYHQGEIPKINIIFVSASKLHYSLNENQKEIILKNPTKIYHLLECDGRYLWLSHSGAKTQQGAASRANKSLQLISHVRQYKNVHKSLMVDIFKFIGVPIPKGST